jgi:sugar lactone lactonase YvrE
MRENVRAGDEWISGPNSLAVDSLGNVYYSDLSRCEIRKIATDGTISSVAGNGTSGYSGDGGPAVLAQINGDASIAVSSAGNLYISDTYNRVVRKVGPDGIIRTIAGTGAEGSEGDGGPAVSASLGLGGGIAVDNRENVYVATADGRIRRITADGKIDTFAGVGATGFSGDGGPATKARIGAFSVASDPDGSLYVLEPFRIRKVTLDGVINTIAGTGSPGPANDGNGGPAIRARIGIAQHATADSQGGLYIAESSANTIRHIRNDGIIESVAGTGAPGWSGDDGPARQATLNWPQDVVVGPDGSLFIAELTNSVIRRIAPDGAISTYAGRFRDGGDGGLAADAVLNGPAGVAIDGGGNIFVSETLAGRIRKIARSGMMISRIAGTGQLGRPATGAALSVDLAQPGALATDTAGNVYFIDSSVVWKLTADGQMSRLAGTGQAGFSGEGGPAVLATLGSPQGLAVDSSGNVFIADTTNNVIREVGHDGLIRTVAGNRTAGFSGNGGPAMSAQLRAPRGIAFDRNGNLYIADYGNRRIRKVSADGTIITVAGNGTLSLLKNGWPDPRGDGGLAINAQLLGPGSVAVDDSGNLFIGEQDYAFYYGNRIRRVTPDGIIDTIAGTGDYGYSGDGGMARNAQLHLVRQLAVDPSGRVLFADELNFRVRILTPIYGTLSPLP